VGLPDTRVTPSRTLRFQLLRSHPAIDRGRVRHSGPVSLVSNYCLKTVTIRNGLGETQSGVPTAGKESRGASMIQSAIRLPHLFPTSVSRQPGQVPSPFKSPIARWTFWRVRRSETPSLVWPWLTGIQPLREILAPSSRASLSAIATACFRLVTF
jgi:hypothetical protein